jgi:hypothetical protein
MDTLTPHERSERMSRIMAKGSVAERRVRSLVHAMGYGPCRDFLSYNADERFDWVITNPPFRLAEEFALHALPLAHQGVALLVRTVFIESVGRLERVFSKHPPTLVAQFAERVPMVRGRLDPKASTATGYAWVVWKKPLVGHTRLVWIPRCRKSLERGSDYQLEFIRGAKLPRTARPKVGTLDLFGDSDLGTRLRQPASSSAA